MRKALKELDDECEQNMKIFNDQPNLYKKKLMILLQKLGLIFKPGSYNFFGIKNRRNSQIDEVKVKFNKIPENIKKFIFITYVLNNKIKNTTPNFCFTIIISNNEKQPRGPHLDKSNHIYYNTIIFGTTINTNEEATIAIQNPNGDNELKLPNDIKKQGLKTKQLFKPHFKGEKVKYKYHNYHNKFLTFNAYSKIHWGYPIKKGRRICVTFHTIANDVLKTTSKYKKKIHIKLIRIINKFNKKKKY